MLSLLREAETAVGGYRILQRQAPHLLLGESGVAEHADLVRDVRP